MTHIFGVVVVSAFWAAFSTSLPHIIFVLFDDLGYNDAGWRPNMPSDELQEAWPAASAMAEKGVVLMRYYTQPICTPTRAAFLTGRYPVNLGLQHDVLSVYDTLHMPTDTLTLAEQLKKAGYRTYGVGKWPLGAHSYAVVPTARGFDEWYGYWHGWLDYYKHIVQYAESTDCSLGVCFLDLHDNLQLDKTNRDVHTTFVLDEKVHELLSKHNDREDSPFFLYYAMANPHIPLEAPDWSLNTAPCDRLSPDTNRKTFCALTVLADKAFANLTDAVDRFFPDDDVIYIASGDNGAVPMYGGSNLPLKGEKQELWEGGVRNNAFIWSNSKTIIPDSLRGTTYKNMFHVTDWYPTFLEMIGQKELIGDNLDGVSHYKAMFEGETNEPRIEFILNIDPCATNHGATANHTEMAYRYKEWKLLLNVAEGRYHELEIVESSELVNALYNIDDDPIESTDLYHEYPDMVDFLTKKIQNVQLNMVQPCNCGLTIVPACPAVMDDAIAVATENGGWMPFQIAGIQDVSTEDSMVPIQEHNCLVPPLL